MINLDKILKYINIVIKNRFHTSMYFYIINSIILQVLYILILEIESLEYEEVLR